MLSVQEKLEILADAAKYDASCASSGAKRSGNGKGVGHSDGTGICHSYLKEDLAKAWADAMNIH